MTVPTWQVRDLRRILRVSELSQHLRQARTDFRSTLSQLVYFNRSVVNPNEYDDEYLLSDQRLTYVYVDEVTAQLCGLNRLLPSNSPAFGTVATAMPPWLLDPQEMNAILQQSCGQGGFVNYHHGPSTNGFFLAILMSQLFIRIRTDVIRGQGYGWYARQGNYVEEGEDNEGIENEEEEEEEETREFQLSDLIHYPIVALGSCHLTR
ncbi:RolB family protein [Agrobacterium vitis]|uniref:RolB family protein n=1 Tax=Agrobacterium vitis TaxID=373 RepID=UPI0015724130|nr:RolB family protein [Agrobacterium vitis]NSY15578.1 hypothetical protein [Agrobacterium vitis]NSY25386.1 hypothetical protein [Agrobacterium vitis]NTA24745.1 hypothetical protein [Agrobacterium vitis]WEO75512.1 RolB family protein [Agrobacterium vitis]